MTEETMVAIVATGSRLGVRPEGMTDILSRARGSFVDIVPTQAELQTWFEGLKASDAPHLFQEPTRQAAPIVPPEVAGVRLSAEERLTRGRPPVPTKQRLPVVTLSAAEAADLAQLSPTQRLTKYRAMQEQAAKA